MLPPDSHPSRVPVILPYNRSIPAIAPAAVASNASRPPAGNPIARPASFGFDEVEVDGEGVGDEPEEVEPALAEAEGPGEDAADDAAEDAEPVSALDASVADAVDDVAVALAFTGAVM